MKDFGEVERLCCPLSTASRVAVTRGLAYGNPFKMGHSGRDEDRRDDDVCDVFDAWFGQDTVRACDVQLQPPGVVLDGEARLRTGGDAQIALERLTSAASAAVGVTCALCARARGAVRGGGAIAAR
jgi:hypothetical protein